MDKISPTRIIIAGGRDFSNYPVLVQSMNTAMEEIEKTNEYDIENIVIVSGCARGADNLGILLANNHNIPVARYPAEWDKYGKSAGYKRNEVMANNADVLVAFWDGESKGTKHMIDIAYYKCLLVMVFDYDGLFTRISKLPF